MRFSKWIVACVIALNVIFCAVALYINYRGSYVSDSLVGSWFAFTTAELWSLAFIKGKKIKHDDDVNENCENVSIDDNEDMRGE